MPFRINMSKRTVILVTGIIFCISIPSCFGTTIYLKPTLSHSSPKTLVSLEKLEKTRPEKRIAPMIFPLLMYETKYKKNRKFSRPPPPPHTHTQQKIVATITCSISKQLNTKTLFFSPISYES